MRAACRIASAVNHELRGLAVDEQGTHGHRSFELERLPIGCIYIQRDGIVLDAGLSFGTQTGAFRNQVYQFASHGDFTLGFLRQGHTDGVANAFGERISS